MNRIRSATLFVTAAALVSTAAFAGQPAAAEGRQPELVNLAAAARFASSLPGLPLALSAAFTAVSMTAEIPAAAPAAVARPRTMAIAEMPPDGMIVVARVNPDGTMETACVGSQAAADAFTRGGRPALAPAEQH